MERGVSDYYDFLVVTPFPISPIPNPYRRIIAHLLIQSTNQPSPNRFPSCGNCKSFYHQHPPQSSQNPY